MPTRERNSAVSVEEARERAGIRAFPTPGGGDLLGGVGLEPEFFPIIADETGQPRGRLPLTRPNGVGVVQVIDGVAGRGGEILPRIGRPPHAFEYPLVNGGRLTFEPGAQVEHSTTVHTGAAAALDDVDRTIGTLRGAFAAHNVKLAAVGMDVWHEVDEVPQQLRAGRYTAQAAYYRQRGRWGGVMMRHTASLQINLDLGPEGVWQERWLLANLISPLLTATFACSPSPGVISTRARAWQELDPTRSGFPRLITRGAGDDPRAEWGDAALKADVMLIRIDDDCFVPGCPGQRFVDWINDGHPRFGWPTVDDLDYHLTTLFFEVRPRGFLELRAGEALPNALRPAQVVLASALIYDDRARAEAVSVLAGHRSNLDDLWRRSAIDGVHDPEIRNLALKVWEIALAGARRLPEKWVGPEYIESTESFLEGLTARGLVPGDLLLDFLDENPARALAWSASEI